MRTFVNVLLSIAFVLYPLSVYFGLQHFQHGALTVVLGVMIGLRLTFFRSKQLPWLNYALGLYLLVLMTATIFDTQLGVLVYPVFMNLTMLSIFAYSLRNKPCVIESLARLQEPDLPKQGVQYTEQVTRVWCVFFALNGLLALGTVIHGDLELWALYNGLISYIIMGVLMAVEWLIRQKVKAEHQ